MSSHAVRLEVFDRPMCCSSGICGPKVDPKLVQFSAALDWLRSQGVQVRRFSPGQQFEAFAANPVVVAAINQGGLTCLPLILVDGVVVSRGEYLAKEKLAAMTGVGRAATATVP